MSFYRTVLAALAAAAISMPVLAADETSMQSTTDESATTSTEQATTSSNATEQTKVNINKASVKELTKVKGLSSSKARAIVAYRKKHGDFKSLDDLANVQGFKKMKPDTKQKIWDQLTTE